MVIEGEYMLKLAKHQEVALSHLRIHDSFALFMEQGTGKTVPTLVRILELLESGKAKNAMVVAPKSTLGSWERDIELFQPDEQDLLNEKVTLINYSKVWRYDKHGNNPYDQQWDVIVLDESHFIKNRTSKRSAFLLQQSLKAKYRYILTGTPIGNGQLENIWSQYAFLHPYESRKRVHSEIFGPYSKFINRYAILNKYYSPSAYINVAELQDIISSYSYRVLKEDCLDLPDKLPDELVKVDRKEKAIYKEMAEHSTVEKLELLADNPLSKMLRLRQIASGFITDEDGKVHELKTEKLTILEELLESLNKKTVIFADFKYSIKRISELLDKMKIKFVVLDGDQQDKKIWRKFQSDESIQVIVCQYQSGSTGIDLFASDTIIYYEPTQRSTLLEQSRDRIHRRGQNQKCSYIHILTKGTIEVSMYRALSNFEDFNERLFTEYIQQFRKG